MIGTTFANFTVLEKINRGGMADIYLVTDKLGQRLVLRVLLPEFRFSWARIRQFKWGCKVMAQLDHPNIVHYYENGHFHGLWYAVLECINGPNLKEAILRGDTNLRANQLKMLASMAAGLAHVHERGFLHLDFNRKTFLSQKHTTRNSSISTWQLPALRSPRRPPSFPARRSSSSRATGPRTRQRAGGHLLVRCHRLRNANGQETHRRRHARRNPEEICQFQRSPAPPRTLVPDITQAIERVILKCLEKEPDRRYPAMSLVVRDLQT